MGLGNGNPKSGDKGSNFNYELKVLQALDSIAETLENKADTTNLGLFAQTQSSVPVTNTTTETSLITTGEGFLSVPPNVFEVGDSYHAKLIGHISSQNNATLRLRVESGLSALADTGLITLPATTNKHWEINIYFTVRSTGVAGIASIATGGIFTYSKNASNTFEGTNFSIINNTTFDTTVLNTIDVTATWGTADPGNNIYSEIFILNKLY
jgi:hypothetical protein